MKNPPREIVELELEREEILELIELELVSEGSKLWARYKQINRELAILWNNLICD